MNPDDSTRTLSESDLAPDPITQFRAWFSAAEAFRDGDGIALVEPHAMALATVDSAGDPHVRMVLLREVRSSGIVFFTNLESDKGVQLTAHPRVSLCFHWDRMHRQVRIRGSAEPISATDSDAYFASRPRESRIAAASSPQSRTIPDRAALEARFEELRARYEGVEEIPRPPHWGGVLVRPSVVEFWQGRPHRMHDRIRFVRGRAGGWRTERLAP